MFENLANKLGGVFDGLKRRGSLKEEDVLLALRDIRTALLEADVALPVVKDFIEKVRVEAVGEKVLRSITPERPAVLVRTGKTFDIVTKYDVLTAVSNASEERE